MTRAPAVTAYQRMRRFRATGTPANDIGCPGSVLASHRRCWPSATVTGAGGHPLHDVKGSASS